MLQVDNSKPDFPWGPFPDGWYTVSFSEELKAGEVKRVTYGGKNLVLWRTASGRAVLSDAYCPHMGAHLGYGGVVRGESIQCPFHSFCFDPEGRCTSTPYEGKIPHRARLGTVPLEEKHGLLLAWLPGGEPGWSVPALDTTGWLPLRHTVWTLSTHPQETSENSVDLGHLPVVHHYEDVRTLNLARADGPYLTARYSMRRKGIPGIGKYIDAEFTVHLWGLGYSLVETWVESMGIRAREFVLNTPVDGKLCHMRAATSIYDGIPLEKVSPALALLPKRLALHALREVIFQSFVNDMKQDFDIWQTKRYVDPPALAQGDGPVGLYRRWCRQFYPDMPKTAAGAGAQPQEMLSVASG